MPLTKEQMQTRYDYAKKNLKRIPLDVQKEKYDAIKAAADSAGESVNGYIKKAIDDRMERDGFPLDLYSKSTRVPSFSDMPHKSAPTLKDLSHQQPTLSQLSSAAADPQNVPQSEPQAKPNSAGLPVYLTPDILAHIDAKRFLSGDNTYQLEIGTIIGMDNLSSLADYLKRQTK